MKRKELKRQVLVVSGEEHCLATCREHLVGNGISDVLTLSDSHKVLPLLDVEPVAVTVLDISEPDVPGLELLSKVVQHSAVPVIVTAGAEIETAVQCIKLGAFDYVVKPINHGRLAESVKRALDLRSANEGRPPKKQSTADDGDYLAGFSELVTRNRKMRELFRYAELLAGSGQPILITGETGVGKELMARAIHKLSGCRGEYVALNAAGLDDAMFSDALFGHQRGAFTGADQSREGLVARAAGGTLFLDEIGDLNELSQIKLLRLLQEHEYYPVGSDLTRKSHARVLLATNRDLQKRITEGRFRPDLYYRLCSHQVRIPPLRERKDDLPLLLDHFIGQMSQRLGIQPPTYTKNLLELLDSYDFPGNVRELQGMVDDAVLCRKSDLVSDQPFLRSISLDSQQPAPQSVSLADGNKQHMLEALWGHFPTLREAEDLLIGTALEVSKGNQRIAASMLGLNRQTLNMRLKVRKG